VCRLLDGTMRLQYRGRELQWKELPQRPARRKVARPKPVATGKAVRKPRADHPWRKIRAVVGPVRNLVSGTWLGYNP